MSQRIRQHVWLPVIVLLALSACGGPAGEAEPGGEPFVPDEGDVGDVPLAAMVNGQPITLQTYERELARHLAGTAALGWESATDSALETQVLDLLIEYELIRQTAERQGVIVSADQVEAEVNAAVQVSGSQQDFEAWLEDLAPHEPISKYAHNLTGEDNADAHLKRTVMGREVVVAITRGQLDFGPWEQIFYGEFDGRRRKRALVPAGPTGGKTNRT